ncbi:uncharacterized protein [Dysidea avara]|uniref:uncharacterized protein n=1 Tax=Dysidea avara TaxID=196820 RepID=UPI00332DB162
MVRAKVKQVNFLLDTGSAVTLLRLDVWKQCCNMPDQLEMWNGTHLVGVDGTPLTVIGIRKINFCFADTNFPHSVLVVESLLCEGILGMDFLQHNWYLIDLTKEGGTLYIGPGKTEIVLSTTVTAKGECASVSVAHMVCIPAGSVLDITANVQGSVSNGGTYLLKGTEGKDSLALIVGPVVSPSDRKVIVRVLNPQKQHVTLHHNATIAWVHSLDTACVAATDTLRSPKATTPVTSEKWLNSPKTTHQKRKQRHFFSAVTEFRRYYC